MTELERARRHLAICQEELSYYRRNLLHGHVAYKAAERHFLAALSWVWDAQERQKIKIGDTVSWIVKGRRRFSKIAAIHEAA